MSGPPDRRCVCVCLPAGIVRSGGRCRATGGQISDGGGAQPHRDSDLSEPHLYVCPDLTS